MPPTGLHALQRAFIENGAIQCGYCTPAQILAAKSLLDQDPNPSEGMVREALSGVLCRCTGYLKPVQAVLKAAAVLRGDAGPVEEAVTWDFGRGADETAPEASPADGSTPTGEHVDAVRGSWSPQERRPGRSLESPSPRWTRSSWRRESLRTRRTSTCKACWLPRCYTVRTRTLAFATSIRRRRRALPGVAAVLTWKDLPRVIWSTAGQSDPIPGPLDTFSLDNKVRFVGDRVAFVAAESAEIAELALTLIKVDYELLPAILDPAAAMAEASPRIHDEAGVRGFCRTRMRPRTWRPKSALTLGTWRRDFAAADRDFRGGVRGPKGPASIHRAPRGRDLLGRGRPSGDSHVHAGAVPCAADARACAAAARQAHPRDQTSDRRRIRRQAGSPHRGRGCPSHNCHNATGAVRILAG